MEKKLTKAEEEIMQMLWKYGPSTVSDLISKMEEPHPPHSTISSIFRILEKKGFVYHKAYGRTYEYYPSIQKSEYSRVTLRNIVSNYFNGSMNELVHFLVKENDLSLKDLADIYESQKDDQGV